MAASTCTALWVWDSLRSSVKCNLTRVKLCQCMLTNEWYAIKMLQPQHARTADGVENFMNEVRMLCLSQGQHVVRIVHVSTSGTYVKSKGQTHTVVYYVMQYVAHGELFKLVYHTGRLEEPIVRTLMLNLIECTVLLATNRHGSLEHTRSGASRHQAGECAFG